MIILKQLVALVLPPIACCIWGSKQDLRMNWLLTALFYLPGSVHAVNVVSRPRGGDKTDTAIAIERRRAVKMSN